MKQLLEFEGIEANADHMIAEEDLLQLFDDAISAFEVLQQQYSDEADEYDEVA